MSLKEKPTGNEDGVDDQSGNDERLSARDLERLKVEEQAKMPLLEQVKKVLKRKRLPPDRSRYK